MDDGIKARVNHDYEMMMEGIREYKAEQLEFARFRQRIENCRKFMNAEDSDGSSHELIMNKLKKVN